MTVAVRNISKDGHIRMWNSSLEAGQHWNGVVLLTWFMTTDKYLEPMRIDG